VTRIGATEDAPFRVRFYNHFLTTGVKSDGGAPNEESSADSWKVLGEV
jgi:hypothetical protein